jgi:hypothetical protein
MRSAAAIMTGISPGAGAGPDVERHSGHPLHGFQQLEHGIAAPVAAIQDEALAACPQVIQSGAMGPHKIADMMKSRIPVPSGVS